jgi:hypothetical protein
VLEAELGRVRIAGARDSERDSALARRAMTI